MRERKRISWRIFSLNKFDVFYKGINSYAALPHGIAAAVKALNSLIFFARNLSIFRMTGFRMTIINMEENTRIIARVRLSLAREGRVVAVLGVVAYTQLSARSTSLFSMKPRFRSGIEPARKRARRHGRAGRISTGLCGSSTDREIIYWSYANFTARPPWQRGTKKYPTRARFCGRTSPDSPAVWKTVPGNTSEDPVSSANIREYYAHRRWNSRIMRHRESHEKPATTFWGKKEIPPRYKRDTPVIRYIALRGFSISE